MAYDDGGRRSVWSTSHLLGEGLVPTRASFRRGRSADRQARYWLQRLNWHSSFSLGHPPSAAASSAVALAIPAGARLTRVFYSQLLPGGEAPEQPVVDLKAARRVRRLGRVR
jgi:hypothetical protein